MSTTANADMPDRYKPGGEYLGETSVGVYNGSPYMGVSRTAVKQSSATKDNYVKWLVVDGGDKIIGVVVDDG